MSLPSDHPHSWYLFSFQLGGGGRPRRGIIPGIDRRVIALWPGHESVETTQIDLHAHLRQKEEALAKVPPSNLPPGRFRPDDELLAFLEGL